MAREIENVRYDEEFVYNSRGIKLFACKWVPINEAGKALIFICHGYAMECSITMHSTAMRLASMGYAVHGLDYEGHGKSDGLQGYVENMDTIVTDCCDYFSSICEKKENKGKMRYLLGESMGGAIALSISRKKPDYWDGAVLVAPMCKIAADVRPSQMVQNVLTGLCRFIPTWKIIPTKDIIDVAFKEPKIREEIRENPYCYKGKPRLKTGFELARSSMEVEQTLKEISVPFIVLHGEEDIVTDKAVSLELVEVAASTDKSIKLYPEMWHGLLYGEPPENIDIVFNDILEWLDTRTSLENSRVESEHKNRHDSFPHRS